MAARRRYVEVDVASQERWCVLVCPHDSLSALRGRVAQRLTRRGCGDKPVFDMHNAQGTLLGRGSDGEGLYDVGVAPQLLWEAPDAAGARGETTYVTAQRSDVTVIDLDALPAKVPPATPRTPPTPMTCSPSPAVARGCVVYVTLQLQTFAMFCVARGVGTASPRASPRTPVIPTEEWTALLVDALRTTGERAVLDRYYRTLARAKRALALRPVDDVTARRIAGLRRRANAACRRAVSALAADAARRLRHRAWGKLLRHAHHSAAATLRHRLDVVMQEKYELHNELEAAAGEQRGLMSRAAQLKSELLAQAHAADAARAEYAAKAQGHEATIARLEDDVYRALLETQCRTRAKRQHQVAVAARLDALWTHSVLSRSYTALRLHAACRQQTASACRAANAEARAAGVQKRLDAATADAAGEQAAAAALRKEVERCRAAAEAAAVVDARRDGEVRCAVRSRDAAREVFWAAQRSSAKRATMARAFDALRRYGAREAALRRFAARSEALQQRQRDFFEATDECTHLRRSFAAAEAARADLAVQNERLREDLARAGAAQEALAQSDAETVALRQQRGRLEALLADAQAEAARLAETVEGQAKELAGHTALRAAQSTSLTEALGRTEDAARAAAVSQRRARAADARVEHYCHAAAALLARSGARRALLCRYYGRLQVLLVRRRQRRQSDALATASVLTLRRSAYERLARFSATARFYRRRRGSAARLGRIAAAHVALRYYEMWRAWRSARIAAEGDMRQREALRGELCALEDRRGEDQRALAALRAEVAELVAGLAVRDEEMVLRKAEVEEMKADAAAKGAAIVQLEDERYRLAAAQHSAAAAASARRRQASADAAARRGACTRVAFLRRYYATLLRHSQWGPVAARAAEAGRLGHALHSRTDALQTAQAELMDAQAEVARLAGLVTAEAFRADSATATAERRRAESVAHLLGATNALRLCARHYTLWRAWATRRRRRRACAPRAAALLHSVSARLLHRHWWALMAFVSSRRRRRRLRNAAAVLAAAGAQRALTAGFLALRVYRRGGRGEAALWSRRALRRGAYATASAGEQRWVAREHQRSLVDALQRHTRVQHLRPRWAALRLWSVQASLARTATMAARGARRVRLLQTGAAARAARAARVAFLRLVYMRLVRYARRRNQMRTAHALAGQAALRCLRRGFKILAARAAAAVATRRRARLAGGLKARALLCGRYYRLWWAWWQARRAECSAAAQVVAARARAEEVAVREAERTAELRRVRDEAAVLTSTIHGLQAEAAHAALQRAAVDEELVSTRAQLQRAEEAVYRASLTSTSVTAATSLRRRRAGPTKACVLASCTQALLLRRYSTALARYAILRRGDRAAADLDSTSAALQTQRNVSEKRGQTAATAAAALVRTGQLRRVYTKWAAYGRARRVQRVVAALANRHQLALRRRYFAILVSYRGAALQARLRKERVTGAAAARETLRRHWGKWNAFCAVRVGLVAARDAERTLTREVVALKGTLAERDTAISELALRAGNLEASLEEQRAAGAAEEARHAVLRKQLREELESAQAASAAAAYDARVAATGASAASLALRRRRAAAACTSLAATARRTALSPIYSRWLQWVAARRAAVMGTRIDDLLVRLRAAEGRSNALEADAARQQKDHEAASYALQVARAEDATAAEALRAAAQRRNSCVLLTVTHNRVMQRVWRALCAHARHRIAAAHRDSQTAVAAYHKRRAVEWAAVAARPLLPLRYYSSWVLWATRRRWERVTRAARHTGAVLHLATVSSLRLMGRCYARLLRLLARRQRRHQQAGRVTERAAAATCAALGTYYRRLCLHAVRRMGTRQLDAARRDAAAASSQTETAAALTAAVKATCAASLAAAARRALLGRFYTALWLHARRVRQRRGQALTARSLAAAHFARLRRRCLAKWAQWAALRMQRTAAAALAAEETKVRALATRLEEAEAARAAAATAAGTAAAGLAGEAERTRAAAAQEDVLRGERAELEARLRAAERGKAALRDDVRRLERQLEQLQEAKGKLEKAIKKGHEARKELKAAVEAAEEDKAALTQKAAALSDRLAASGKAALRKDVTIAELQGAAGRLAHVECELATVQAEAAGTQAALDASNAAEAALRTEVAALSAELRQTAEQHAQAQYEWQVAGNAAAQDRTRRRDATRGSASTALYAAARRAVVQKAWDALAAYRWGRRTQARLSTQARARLAAIRDAAVAATGNAAKRCLTQRGFLQWCRYRTDQATRREAVAAAAAAAVRETTAQAAADGATAALRGTVAEVLARATSKWGLRRSFRTLQDWHRWRLCTRAAAERVACLGRRRNEELLQATWGRLTRFWRARRERRRQVSLCGCLKVASERALVAVAYHVLRRFAEDAQQRRMLAALRTAADAAQSHLVEKSDAAVSALQAEVKAETRRVGLLEGSLAGMQMTVEAQKAELLDALDAAAAHNDAVLAAEGAARKARDHLQQEMVEKEALRSRFQRQQASYEAAKAEHKAALEAHEAILHAKDQELSGTAAALRALEAAAAELRHAVEDKDAAIAGLHEQLSAAAVEAERVAVEEVKARAALKEKITSLKAAVHGKTAELDENMAERHRLTQEMKTVAGQLVAAERGLEKARSHRIRLEREMTDGSQETMSTLHKVERLLEATAQHAEDLEAANRQLHEENEALAVQLHGNVADGTSKEKMIAALQTRLTDAETKHRLGAEERHSLRIEKGVLKAKLSATDARVCEAQGEIEKLREKAHDLLEEIACLNEEVDIVAQEKDLAEIEERKATQRFETVLNELAAARAEHTAQQQDTRERERRLEKDLRDAQQEVWRLDVALRRAEVLTPPTEPIRAAVSESPPETSLPAAAEPLEIPMSAQTAAAIEALKDADGCFAPRKVAEMVERLSDQEAVTRRLQDDLEQMVTAVGSSSFSMSASFATAVRHNSRAPTGDSMISVSPASPPQKSPPQLHLSSEHDTHLEAGTGSDSPATSPLSRKTHSVRFAGFFGNTPSTSPKSAVRIDRRRQTAFEQPGAQTAGGSTSDERDVATNDPHPARQATALRQSPTSASSKSMSSPKSALRVAAGPDRRRQTAFGIDLEAPRGEAREDGARAANDGGSSTSTSAALVASDDDFELQPTKHGTAYGPGEMGLSAQEGPLAGERGEGSVSAVCPERTHYFGAVSVTSEGSSEGPGRVQGRPPHEDALQDASLDTDAEDEDALEVTQRQSDPFACAPLPTSGVHGVGTLPMPLPSATRRRSENVAVRSRAATVVTPRGSVTNTCPSGSGPLPGLFLSGSGPLPDADPTLAGAAEPAATPSHPSQNHSPEPTDCATDSHVDDGSVATYDEGDDIYTTWFGLGRGDANLSPPPSVETPRPSEPTPARSNVHGNTPGAVLQEQTRAPSRTETASEPDLEPFDYGAW